MGKNIIEIKHLTKSFGNHEVLKDINFSVKKGDITSIIGASGSGKSTLLRCINLLENPSGGEILYNGNNILETKDIPSYRTKVGMVFQNYQLIERFTPLENVSFPLIIRGIDRETSEKKAYELFKKFSLENKINANVNDLSGGEKQRIAILRAMISNPQVYLLDEPTGALDNDNAIKVMEMFLDISESSLVIMVTHNVALAKKYADKIYYLEDGVLHE